MTSQTNHNSSTTANAPVDRIRRGRIQAAIWKQTTEKGSFYSFTLDRSYKDTDGNYQSTASFSVQDALLVSKVANLADTRIRQLLDRDYEQSRSTELDEDDFA